MAIKGLSQQELRTVMYLVGFPNLLVSLHPDYVMTHLMTPLAVDPHPRRVRLGVPEGGAGETGLRSVLRSGLLGPDQPSGLGACESVQRVEFTARPARPAGPDEDGVYQFVTRVARACRHAVIGWHTATVWALTR